MAYGDYSGPDKPDKGQEGGSCNRTLCQASRAIWYNHGSHSWYCADCRTDIEFDSFNWRDWQTNHKPTCGHPMFETRKMIEDREKAKAAYPGHTLYRSSDFTNEELERSPVARMVADGGLGLCKSCGAGEIELDQFATCKDYNEHRAALRGSAEQVRLGLIPAEAEEENPDVEG